jgi:hypothetical protein
MYRLLHRPVPQYPQSPGSILRVFSQFYPTVFYTPTCPALSNPSNHDSQDVESLFDDLNYAELEEYTLEKERERQAEEKARASVNKEPAPQTAQGRDCIASRAFWFHGIALRTIATGTPNDRQHQACAAKLCI